MKKTTSIAIGIIVIILLAVVLLSKNKEGTFPEDIGNAVEKADLIRVTSPEPNTTIKSPLVIKGEARGTWFFEASFPVTLVDSTGLIIAQHYATAQGEWMTEEFVPFETTLTFEAPEYTQGENNGNLILRKDNPTGLPEHDDNLVVPIQFQN